MDHDVSQSARRLGVASALIIVLSEALYAISLAVGLSAAASSTEPIPDPYFTLMEILILIMAPAIVTLAVAVYGTCDAGKKPLALAATVFAAILATITSAVHFSILFLSRSPAFSGMEQVFSFEWPSVVYVLDILAWDFFFPLFAVFLALSFARVGLEEWIRRFLLISGILAILGLAGAAVGDMQLRNVGILGYVGAFTVAAALIGLSMRRAIR
ncbi:MAG: hypothetical protein HKN30_05645 [Sulfitobacter sp.]|nr:hypothetical protein [Sulfitobacter sp.]